MPWCRTTGMNTSTQNVQSINTYTQRIERVRDPRPRINSHCRELIGRLAEENHLWGAPRIHGELLKLGIVVSERTVSRYLAGRPRRSSQAWRTFLANHLGQCTRVSVLSPYPLGDDVVDAFARTCRSTQSSDRQPASRQCARIDWPASVRPTCLGLLVTQDHFRDRRKTQRSGRASPRTGCLLPTLGGSRKVDSLLSHGTDGNH
jgi:hypothetical protein